MIRFFMGVTVWLTAAPILFSGPVLPKTEIQKRIVAWDVPTLSMSDIQKGIAAYEKERDANKVQILSAIVDQAPYVAPALPQAKPSQAPGVFYKPDQAPPVDEDPFSDTAVRPQPPGKYRLALDRAVNENKRLYVYVGCDEKPVKGAITVRVDTLEGYKGPCIVVAVPDGDWMIYERTITFARTIRNDPVCTT